jgi:hypothetical protein
MRVDDDAALFLVSIRPDRGLLDGEQDMVRLAEGLHICLTTRSRSRLYHDVKARARPDQLLVAPLLGLPKFKGMEPGAATAVARMER